VIPEVITQSFNFSLHWEYEQRPWVMSHSVEEEKKANLGTFVQGLQKKKHSDQLIVLRKKSVHHILWKTAQRCITCQRNYSPKNEKKKIKIKN